MIHIHPRDDHRHFPRAFKSKYICLLEDREISRNLKQKRKSDAILNTRLLGTRNVHNVESTKTTQLLHCR